MMGTTQAERGLYVQEIPGGGALNPEKHMYEEAFFVLRGRGITEVWHEGGPKVSFEWGEGSVFGIPLNTHHRLVNGSREPAIVVGSTTAPWMMNLVQNTDFIFNCDHQFTDRFGGRGDYFAPGENKFTFGAYAKQTWLTVLPKSEYQDYERESLDIARGRRDLDVVLEPLSTGQLSGRMVDSEGNPLPEFRLWLRSTGALDLDSVLGVRLQIFHAQESRRGASR